MNLRRKHIFWDSFDVACTWTTFSINFNIYIYIQHSGCVCLLTWLWNWWHWWIIKFSLKRSCYFFIFSFLYLSQWRQELFHKSYSCILLLIPCKWHKRMAPWPEYICTGPHAWVCWLPAIFWPCVLCLLKVSMNFPQERSFDATRRLNASHRKFSSKSIRPTDRSLVEKIPKALLQETSLRNHFLSRKTGYLIKEEGTSNYIYC